MFVLELAQEMEPAIRVLNAQIKVVQVLAHAQMDSVYAAHFL
jgi:hypothetical protein